MPKEVLEIEIRAKDNISTVAKKIQKQLENLRVSATKGRVEKFTSALQVGVPASLLPYAFGSNVESRLKALESLRRKYTKEVNTAMRSLNRAFREGDQEKIKAMADAVKTYGTALRYVNQAYNTYIRQVARAKIEERQSSRIMRLSNAMNTLRGSFRRAATDFVWSSLSMLGIVWSLDAALNSTAGVIMDNVRSLSNYEQAAFDVATWLAIAKRQGFDWADSLDISDAVNKSVQSGLNLKATWGSVYDALMLFFADIFSDREVKIEMDESFNKLLETLNSEPIKSGSKSFVVGFFKGIGEGLDTINNALDRMDINKLETITETFGRITGKVFVLYPLLRVALTTMQVFFSVVQAIFKFIEMALGYIGRGLLWIGGKIWDKIGGKIVEFASKLKTLILEPIERFAERTGLKKLFGWIAEQVGKLGVTRTGARGVLTRASSIAARGLGAIPELWLASELLIKPVGVTTTPTTGITMEDIMRARNVTINQYVNIGNVSSELDLDAAMYRMARDMSYQMVR